MKLLRVLQERQVLPLGGRTRVHTDVRLIVGANVILEEEAHAGRFRPDLFHRLNEFTLSLVRLRDRREDTLFLAERFRCEANREVGKDCQEFSPDAQAYMLTYDWPGNIRELRNAVRRAVLLSSKTIEIQHLRQMLSPRALGLQTMYGVPLHKIQQGDGLHDVIDEVVANLEKTLIQRALAETGGNKSRAAARLHIGYRTLYRKLHEYDIN